MAVSKALEKFLKQNKIKYEVIEHRKVFTAHDSAETQHIKLTEQAKAVLLKGKKFHLAVLPAGHNCDFKTLSKLAGEKVSMAKEKDITRLFETKIGLIAPFGSFFNLPVFIDKKLLKNKKLVLPAGSYTDSVRLVTKDYLKLENPVQGNFSTKK